MLIQPASTKDAQEICELWNHYVKHTSATFRPDCYSPKMIEEMIEELAACHWAFLVAREEKLLGFALYRQFRNGAGYVHSMENSLYLWPDAQGKGVGTALMTALEDHARAHKIHSLTGAITSENMRSVDFHKKLGFEIIGEIPEIGHKFGKWLGVIFMQKILK